MKAETLLVLEESRSKYRVLLLFEGEKNGNPMEFIIFKWVTCLSSGDW
jgi:hypothetical protein